MDSTDISQNIFMIAVTASAIPAFYAIMAGWTRSASANLQRRGTIAILISIIALGATMLLSAIGRGIEGNYLLAGAFGLGAVLMVLSGLISRTHLQLANHLATTGETLELTTEQRRRFQLIFRTTMVLVVIILALIIANIVIGVVGVRG